MNLETYIDLEQLFQQNQVTREQNRAFGLLNQDRDDSGKLIDWRDEYLNRLPKPRVGAEATKYLHGITLILGVFAIIFGIFSGAGLLSYSGREPVNIIYIISNVVFVPLLTMSLTIWSIAKADTQHSTLVHISPAYWMERVIGYLPNSARTAIKKIQINPLLVNLVAIKRSQLLALLFSIGLFVALMWKVSTEDLAFAWSTTLQITPNEFHDFLNTIALPWRSALPSAVPSIELIEQSHYLRLGGKLDTQMINNAVNLGEWWKFLAMATLFYAIFLRLVLWIVASVRLSHATDKSVKNLPNAQKVLYEMNTPLVSSQANKPEQEFVRSSVSFERICTPTDRDYTANYDAILGWAISKEELETTADSLLASSHYIANVGGKNTLTEDANTARSINGNILLIVKAWEPPTMDIIDFLHELSSSVAKITVLPLEVLKISIEVTLANLIFGLENSKRTTLKRFGYVRDRQNKLPIICSSWTAEQRQE